MRGSRPRSLAAGAALAGWDLLAFYRAHGLRARRRQPAPAVAGAGRAARLASVAGLFWPGLGRQARQKQAEWTVKAAGVQVANGTAPADLHARLGQLKDQAPQLVPAIRKVEAAQEQVRHDERWKAVQAEALSLAAIDDPEKPLADDRGLPPRVSRHAPPRRGPGTGPVAQGQLAARQSAVERQIVDDLIRSESLPNAARPT